MRLRIITAVSSAAMMAASPGAYAQSSGPAASSANAESASDFAKFRPKNDINGTRIDYTVWDEALKYFVFGMGKSIREGSPRPEPGIGTRRVYGHDSRYRLEGNRIIFEYMTPEVIASLTEYRRDLENTASLVDISKLSRNEQLSYWINLHNAAIIEQIALDYPVSQPSSIRVGESKLPLDETAFLTVAGVKMSPKDIRTKIVYPNWKDPRVIYGFFRGEIGGPSIQSEAFTARKTGDLLDKSAEEFVNSLRGTQKSGSTLDVSKIYEEARPFYFPNWPTDLKTHLLTFSNDKVSAIINETGEVRANIYEADVADLSKGERDPNYGYVVSGDRVKGQGLPEAILRLLREQQQKVTKIIRDNELVGRVTFIDIDLPGEKAGPEEIE